MTASTSDESTIRKIAFASTIGTAIQWYDFFIYNVAAILVFDKLFFAAGDKGALMKSLSVYAVGFVARPIGGIVCGHLGDRRGRKTMLVGTLLITGIATFLIGLLLPYKSDDFWPGIGIWAPILLVVLRFAQGFATGGEWGAAVLMPVEHSASGKRGFYASWPQVGVPIGLFLSNLVFFWLNPMPEAERQMWGWRLPFLLSVLLVAVGVYIRVSVPESPMIDAIEPDKRPKVPLLKVLKQHPMEIILAMGARIVENGGFYLYTAFLLVIVKEKPQLYSTPSMFYSISLAALVVMVTILLFGWMSDRVGRKAVYLFGAIFTGLFAFPSFWMINTARPGLITLAIICALGIGWAAMYAPQASFFSESFPTEVRNSAASFTAQVSTIFAGAVAPIIATWLMHRWGGRTWPVALYLICMAAVTTVSVFLATETVRKDIAPENLTSDPN